MYVDIPAEGSLISQHHNVYFHRERVSLYFPALVWKRGATQTRVNRSGFPSVASRPQSWFFMYFSANQLIYKVYVSLMTATATS